MYIYIFCFSICVLYNPRKPSLCTQLVSIDIIRLIISVHLMLKRLPVWPIQFS